MGIENCGPYPAASSFADSFIDANGAVNYKPLTPDQNARYLAAISAYQQCLGKEQGTPPCPLGEFWSGGYYDGVWVGQCVSTYTGQPTTPVAIIPGAVDPTQQPASPYTVAGPIAPAPAPATNPTTPAPSTNPTTPATPATPAPIGGKVQPHDLFGFGNGGSGDDYCLYYPDDPFCSWGWTLGGLIGGIGLGGGTTQQIVYQQSGLLAADVHNIVDKGLQGLWGVIVGALDLGLRGAISAVQNAVTALGNALKAAYSILSRLGGMVLKFLGHMWYTVLQKIVIGLQDVFGWLRQLYVGILKPALLMLQDMRLKILEIWKRFVVPVLIVIQDVRKVLAILGAFHIKWAQKLDLQLADLERRITAPLLTLLGYINAVANWMNLLVTAGYLLQKSILLNSIKAYIGSILNLSLNTMNKPLSAHNAAAARQAANAPTSQQTKADLSQFLQNGSGSMAVPIATAQQTFDEYLQLNG